MSWIAGVTGDAFTEDMLDELKARIEAVESLAGVAVDTETSGGPAGKAIAFADQGGTAYQVIITWQTATPGSIGEVGVVNDSATGATVYNAGIAGIPFSYKVVK